MDVFSCGRPGVSRCSALALLVTRVLADHHDAAMATDHLALVTDRLDARVYLHECPVGVGWLLVPVDDAAASQVVRRELHHDPVLGEDPDVVLAHLAADVGENLVPVAQLDAEHGIRQGLHNGALDLDHAFFLRHVLTNCSWCRLPFRAPEPAVRTVSGWPGNLSPRLGEWTSWTVPRTSPETMHGQPRGTAEQTHVGPTHQSRLRRRSRPNP